jgi:hypothetical protein
MRVRQTPVVECFAVCSTATRLRGADTSLKAPPGTAATAGASAEGAAVTGTHAAGACTAGAHAAGAQPSRPAVVTRPAAAKPRAVPGDRELHIMVPTRDTIIDGLAQLVPCRGAPGVLVP